MNRELAKKSSLASLASVSAGQLVGALASGLNNPKPEFSVTGTMEIEHTIDKILGMDITFLLAKELEQLLMDDSLIHSMDTINILMFNISVETMQPHIYMKDLKKDLAARRGLLSRISSSGEGGTRLFNAMEKVYEQRKQFMAKRDKKYAKVFLLIVLTDGDSQDDPKSVMEYLQRIHDDIPRFYQFTLGINLGQSAEAILREVTKCNCKRCTFENVRGWPCLRRHSLRLPSSHQKSCFRAARGSEVTHMRPSR